MKLTKLRGKKLFTPNLTKLLLEGNCSSRWYFWSLNHKPTRLRNAGQKVAMQTFWEKYTRTTHPKSNLAVFAPIPNLSSNLFRPCIVTPAKTHAPFDTHVGPTFYPALSTTLHHSPSQLIERNLTADILWEAVVCCSMHYSTFSWDKTQSKAYTHSIKLVLYLCNDSI